MNRSKQKGSDSTRDKNATLRQHRIDRFFLRWRRYRVHRTLITPLLVVALYFTARTFYGGNDKSVQLKFVENSSEQTVVSGTSEVEPSKPVLSGEAYETAVRLRESGALLMAVSLSSFEEFRMNARFPATVNEILTGLQKRSLLPPGIEIKDGALRSTLSELKLNYRAEPFSFEILSLPISNHGGSAILFRFPLPPAEANSVMYFEAQNPVQLPAPFSTNEQITAAGWKIRHWRGGAMPLNETVIRDLREQNEWLNSQNQGR
ncbi:MAG TPA: hypothetical protein PKD26_14680 [Pyrinomonadaceae bacterium]|nr:hypothetical protein [Pyrinomonadaceae bacterium]